jgi:hypothetical protein
VLIFRQNCFFMQEKDPILRERELDGYRSIAQKIRNRLQQLENANDKDKRRWVWELLQNAIDAGSGKFVDIKIIINTKFLSFQHNGGYFQPRSVTNLVHQISSKEGTQSIGRFGTGFLTTHTLSRCVEVESVFESYGKFYPFKLEMDRTGKTEDALVLGIEKTWDLYRSAPRQVILKPETFSTLFKYRDPHLDVAQATLRDAMDFMAYCFAFVPYLNTFRVENEIQNTQILYQREKANPINAQLSILTIDKIAKQNTDKIQILFIQHEKMSLAIAIQSVDAQIRLLPISKNTPRLFCAYPLIGTEDFWYPFVLNSVHFNPKTERDKLYLKGDTSDVRHNKSLLESTLPLYKLAVEYMIAQQWKEIWRIVPSALPPKDDDFDSDWYEKKIHTWMKDLLFQLEVVENEADKLMRIRDCFFPNHEKEAIRITIWEYAYALMPNQLPAQKQVHDWYEITKEWKTCALLTVEKLVIQLSAYSKVTVLAQHLGKTEADTLSWLNEFIHFIELQQPLLLENHRILPNQKGDFCLKSALYEDRDKVEDILKDVLFQLGDDWRKEYLHNAITKAVMRNKARSRLNILQAINGVIDRNENYRFTDLTKQKLAATGLRPLQQLNLHNQLAGQLFTKKENYVAKLRMILGIELPSYEKIILENSVDTEMRKAVSVLVALRNEANDTPYRKTLFEIAVQFDKKMTSIRVPTLLPDTWLKADKWLLQAIITDIENCKQISLLAQRLQRSEAESLELLNQLFTFIVNYSKMELLTDKAVYPNQKGVFCKKTQLFEDDNLPVSLKVILKDLEMLVVPNQPNKGWEYQLLHQTITAFKQNYKFVSKNLKELSTRINDLLRRMPKDADTVRRNVVLRLLSIGNAVDEKQQTIWAFSKNLYGDSVPDKIVLLENAADLDITECLDWMMTRIALDIEGNQFVETLEKELVGNVKAIEWLDKVLDFLQKDIKWKHLLDDYAIIPNQNEDFCKLSNLYLDYEIPALLKKVIKSFNYEWIGELVHDKIYLSLPSIKQRTKDDAAFEINTWFRNYQDSKQDPKFVGAWRTLQQYFKQEDEPYLLNHFGWVWLHKAEVTLATLGSDEEKEHIWQIIESGHASLFAKIAKGLSGKEMEELADNPQAYQQFKAWQENTKEMNELAENTQAYHAFKIWQESGTEATDKTTILNELSEQIGIKFGSWDKLVEELKKATRKINFAQVPPPSTQNNAIDWAAIAQSNEDARKKLYDFLATPEAQAEGYDRSAWNQQSNTIITGVKRLGLGIKIVIKGAKNGTVYFDNAKKEQKTLQDPLSEFWVYDGKDLFRISVGDIIHIWNMIGIKTYMFDFKKS